VVFQCPHRHHTAGRDANAAFNILRFVVCASLQTFEVHREFQSV
jgi:transposase